MHFIVYIFVSKSADIRKLFFALSFFYCKLSYNVIQYNQLIWKEVIDLAVSYNKLWKMLIDKNMKKMQLKEATGIGSTTLSKLSKNQPVSMEVMMKICSVLNCNIGDIMDVTEQSAQ